MPEKNDRWAERYRTWRQTLHGEEVFDAATKITRQIQAKGFKHYSMQAIIYIIRHRRHLRHGPDADDYKINNNFTSYLAREISRELDLPDDFFSVRGAASLVPLYGQAELTL